MIGPEVVCLDMDGTILRLGITLDEVREAREALRQLFGPHGIESPFRPLLRTIRESLETLRVGGAAVEEIAAEAYRIVDDMEERGAIVAVACAKAEETLRQLHEQGRCLALVSNNGRRGILRALDSAGLSVSWFSAIISRDDVNEEKPSGAPVIEALRRLGGARENLLLALVGDQAHDMRCGKAAQRLLSSGASIVTVGISGGMSSLEELQATQCMDAFVTGLQELPALLQRLGVRSKEQIVR